MSNLQQSNNIPPLRDQDGNVVPEYASDNLTFGEKLTVFLCLTLLTVAGILVFVNSIPILRV